jgi:hypothetical protein
VRTATSILAGCSHATAFLKAVILGTADRLVATYTGITLYIMVDDMTITASGSRRQVERMVGAAGKRLTTDLEDELGGKVNQDKTYITSTEPRVAKGIQKAIGKRFQVKRVAAVRNLGVGFSWSHRALGVQKPGWPRHGRGLRGRLASGGEEQASGTSVGPVASAVLSTEPCALGSVPKS